MKTKDKTIQRIIYLAMALLLLLGVGSMPYFYYQLMRFLVFAGFGYLAYLQYKESSIDRMILFIILALLFQPFFPINLGKDLWKIIDVLIAAYLIYLLALTLKNKRNKK